MSDGLRQWCRDNWNRLPDKVRQDCINHLDAWFDPKTKTADIERLKNYENELFFHFGLGMVIRNRLRGMLTDMELPVLTKDDEGQPYGPSQNWDDYYTGAIDEFLERYK